MAFKILIVDDDADLRALMSRFLVREGYEVDTAENGCTAIEKLRAHRPDLVVCDVRMPVCDGIEFDRRLRTLPARIPILFMSGYVGADDVQLSGSPNYVGFLEKPVPRNEVVDWIRKFERNGSSDEGRMQKGTGHS